MAEVPALDPELLPENLRDRVFDLAERFQAPPDYAAAALIVMLAGSLGRRALIRPKRHDDWVVYCNLWGAVVGQRVQVLVWPDISSNWEDIDRPVDVRAERCIESMIDRFLRLSPEDPFRGRFSPSAQELFSAWRRELELKIRRGDLPSALESHLAKYRSLFPKLALILHLAGDEAMDPEIPLVEAERAASFCDYLEQHARRVYGCAARQQQRIASALVERLRTGVLSDRFSLRDVYVHGWAGIDTPERARTALAVLVEAGWVRKAPVPVGHVGRPSEEYVVNPRIR